MSTLIFSALLYLLVKYVAVITISILLLTVFIVMFVTKSILMAIETLQLHLDRMLHIYELSFNFFPLESDFYIAFN